MPSVSESNLWRPRDFSARCSCLKALLTALLKPVEAIDSVEVLNPETSRETAVDKGATLELRVALANGAQVHVEMQLSPHPGIRERLLFYWARVFTTGLGRGGAYTELKPVIGIFIFDSQPSFPR